jgi:hypothetical protein
MARPKKEPHWLLTWLARDFFVTELLGWLCSTIIRAVLALFHWH